MNDLNDCKAIIRDWPITVERYDSGQIGFIARPQINNKRLNRSFSTSRYPTAEDAAKAAVAFCQDAYQNAEVHLKDMREAHPIPDALRPRISDLVNKCLQARMDPVKILTEGMQIEFRRRLEAK